MFLLRRSEFGGEKPKVGEHRGVVVFELEAYPEPKVLSRAELCEVFKGDVTIQAIADHTGLSWSAVQERLRPTRVWDPERKRFIRRDRH